MLTSYHTSEFSNDTMDFKHTLMNTSMPPAIYSRFIRFLQEELSLSSDSIAIAQRSVEQNPGPLPMILWQYGLVTLKELDRIYDWLETV